MRWKEKLGKYPIPVWLFAVVTVLYCESLLHLWTMESFSAGRFAAVLAFALGFGGILGLILSFLGGRKWSKWISAGLMTLLTIVYIVEYFVNDAYMCYMPLATLLSGAQGVATDFGGIVVRLIAQNLWRILVFLLPPALYALLAAPVETRWRTRGFLLAGVAAAYCLSFGIVQGVGTDAERMNDAYNFDSAVRCFGLNVGTVLEQTHSAMPETAEVEFIPVEIPQTQPAPEASETLEEPVVYEPNIMDFDFEALAQSEGNSGVASVYRYVSTVQPTMKNEYTGLFAGKNLILITAEAFTSEVIDEERTPTLYRMAAQGIQFRDYYQPAWGASTTSGEFSNLIGIVPTTAGMCMKEAIQQDLFLTMGHQLQAQNYYSAAYHNHNKDFYDRDKTHTELGYDRFLALYGGLEGVQAVFPESDLEMIDATVPQYIDQQPFSIYYMTVSGHCMYSQKENAMARKNYDVVADMDCCEAVKCYYASQQELEYAMQSLVEQLEEAGIADDTVIVIATDHYPYGLERSGTWRNTSDYLAELYGVDSYDKFVRDHSTLIIWSGCLEGKNIVVDEPVYSLDILPTLSNLFGLDYDSRLLVGRDVFSGESPLVLWPDFSWKTDKGTYDAQNGTFTPAEGQTVDEEYITIVKNIVRNKIDYSRQVQNLDYFNYLSKARQEQ
ncbi:MAG: LTA synthase family protein [Eubacteriales bacterium]|nr:LTA synthase family protein [Eubacteriales bacterium]